jgi:putative transposase
VGVTTHGAPVLLGLAPGSDEGTDPWHGFLEDLTGRGLRAPLLVITDGAPGLIAAVQLAFGRWLRQRCLVHRARNVLAKVPSAPKPRSRPRSGRSSTTSTPRPATPRSPRPGQRAHAFASRYQHR